jgi:AraC-like DNA-binding protein
MRALPSLSQRHPGLSIRLMRHVLEEHGRDGQTLLRVAGVSNEILTDPHIEVTRAQELAAVEHFQRVTADLPGIALETGRRYRVVTYGAFGLGMLTARDLRHALRIGIAYQRLSYSLMSFSMELEGDGDVRVVMDDRDIPTHVRGFLVERDLAAVVSLCDDLWGSPFPFTAVEVAMPAPGHAGMFEQVLRVPVRFGAQVNALTFPADLLEHALPQSTPAMEELYERQCQALLARATSTSDLVERVLQRLVRSAHTPMPTLDEVASDLAVSPRTLRRQLASAGTSYGTLVAEVREQLAKELLTATSLTVEQVAAELGYAETSSFSRAFTRWTGQPPSVFRASR